MQRDVVDRHLCAHRPAYMQYGSEGRAGNTVGYHGFGMAVNYAVHIRVFLVDFAVDETLGIAFWCIRIYGNGIADFVFFDVFAARDQSGCQGLGDEEGGGVLGIADRDVAVCWKKVG